MTRLISQLTRASLVLLAFSSCGVDDRALSYDYRPLSAGGAGSAGVGAASGPTGGDSGASDGGEPGSPSAGSGGSLSDGTSGGGAAGDAGAASELGGAAGSAGAPVGGAGAPITSGSANGGGDSAGSAGHAGGGAVEFPCGDLNGDGVDDCAQTLVLNSRFDAAVTNWDAEPQTTQKWDARNATSKQGSGSFLLTNTSAVVQAVGAGLAGSHQCIAVTPTASYDFAARVMLAEGETTGQAGINAWLFDDEACRGNLVTGNTPIVGGIAGTWTVLKGKLFMPGGVHSMYVRLVAIKPFSQPSLSVLVDDVLVAKR